MAIGAADTYNACIINGFKIIVSNENMGTGIRQGEITGLIEKNVIQNTSIAILLSNTNINITNNIILNAEDGSIE